MQRTLREIRRASENVISSAYTTSPGGVTACGDSVALHHNSGATWHKASRLQRVGILLCRGIAKC